jgi:hypothetical protein
MLSTPSGHRLGLSVSASRPASVMRTRATSIVRPPVDHPVDFANASLLARPPYCFTRSIMKHVATIDRP